MSEICQWDGCHCLGQAEYVDSDGLWVLCFKHFQKAEKLDRRMNALRVGVFAGIFTGFLDF